MDPPPDVLVLGAGIAGCSLAYHLTRRGIRPLVYDPRTPSAGATGRSAGVLTEQLWDPWDVEVARETRREYADLSRGFERAAYRQNGFVRIASDPVAVQLLDDAVGRWRGWGVEVEELTEADLDRRLPWGEFHDVGRAVFSPHDAIVDPGAVAAIYAEGARKAGATFDFGRPMSRLRPLEEGWEIETPTGTLSGRSLVVAAGAWSKAILRGIDHPMPLAPYRTQAAVLRVPGALGEEFPTVHELDSDVYVRPESEGRILAGDGTEETESDPERFPPHADQPFLEHLAATLSRRFPGWRESEVAGSWAGVCTATPDRRPIVGSLGGSPPLFVLTGFNGFGVMRAGGIARRLADLIAALPSAEESLAPVAPGRFRGSIGGFRPRPGFTVEGGDDPRY